MPKIARFLIPMSFAVLAACDSKDTTVDAGINSHPLTELKAGIWIDPYGCDHWIIDDGVEGYLSQRLDPYGRPVCSGAGNPGEAVWDYKVGGPISEAIF